MALPSSVAEIQDDRMIENSENSFKSESDDESMMQVSDTDDDGHEHATGAAAAAAPASEPELFGEKAPELPQTIPDSQDSFQNDIDIATAETIAGSLSECGSVADHDISFESQGSRVMMLPTMVQPTSPSGEHGPGDEAAGPPSALSPAPMASLSAAPMLSNADAVHPPPSSPSAVVLSNAFDSQDSSTTMPEESPIDPANPRYAGYYLDGPPHIGWSCTRCQPVGACGHCGVVFRRYVRTRTG